MERISQDDILRRKALNRTLEIADQLQMKEDLEEAKKEVENEKKKVIKNLHKLNIPIEQIAQAVELTEKEVEEILKEK